MNTKSMKHILSLAISLFIVSSLTAQQVSTMYFMKNLPERTSYNPAFQPRCNWWLDLPFAPNFKLETGNNSVDFKDVIFNKNINGVDSTITFLDANANPMDFYNNLRKTTRIYSEFSLNLLGFGWRKNKNYYTFNVSQKMNMAVYLPKDLFKLALEGTPDYMSPTNFNLKHFGIDANVYTEYALGFSRQVNDKLTLGGTLKFLNGQANITTDIDKFDLEGSIDNWNIDAEGEIRTNIPLVNVPYDVNGHILFDQIAGPNMDSITDFMLYALTNNLGAAIDLGATYKITPKLELSAAILDLGFINWKSNPNIYEANGDFEFNGIDYTYGADGQAKLDSIGEAFKNAFVHSGKADSYTNMLNARVNVGAEYSVVKDKIGFGILSSTLFANKTAFTDATASVNLRPYHWFSTSFSYSIINGEFSTIGFGAQLQLLPWNMYIVMDRIPLSFTPTKVSSTSSYDIPNGLKSFNIQAGIVWSIGNKKKDDDKDGVHNRKDDCPGTPFGYLVDKKGCTVDTDKDGVADNMDKCPETPLGYPVDTVGCPLDDDKDGVFNPKDKCPSTPAGVMVDSIGCPVDTDKDGVADYLDKCPNTAIGVKVDDKGCPVDTDGDGVTDNLDKCPGTPKEAYGAVDMNGCPKDDDKDGVANYLDKCPNTPDAGRKTVDATGCNGDSDGDGIVDYEDNCPTTAGPRSNNGCPEVKAEVKKIFEKALQGIQFETGKAIIKPSSFTILNEVVRILKENPDYLVEINGHTDNVGKPEANEILSQKRAEAVKQYLVNKGIATERLKATGYGDMIPVESNVTKEGRAKNRRVEFVVKFER